jgi:hypothetical protein
VTGNDVLLRSEQSGGAVAVVVNAVPAEFDGPPLHSHEFDETFYVLDGTLTFQLNEELTTATRGELVFAPRGTAHTFANLSGAPALSCWSAPRPASSATSPGSPPSGTESNRPTGHSRRSQRSLPSARRSAAAHCLSLARQRNSGICGIF